MKKNYPLALLLILLFSGCGKDVLEKYDNRIIGAWRITEVKRAGFGGNVPELPFRNGTVTFFENGGLDYISEPGTLYKGHWDIERRFAGNHSHYELRITASDLSGQQVLAETYDDIIFSGSARFRAKIFNGLRTYITHFRR